MRLLIVLLVLIFAVLGAVFGALNSERVAYDFYFITATAAEGRRADRLRGLVGWLLGGIVVYFGLVLRLRRRVRTLARELSVAEKAQREPVDAPVVIEAERQSAVNMSPMLMYALCLLLPVAALVRLVRRPAQQRAFAARRRQRTVVELFPRPELSAQRAARQGDRSLPATRRIQPRHGRDASRARQSVPPPRRSRSRDPRASASDRASEPEQRRKNRRACSNSARTTCAPACSIAPKRCSPISSPSTRTCRTRCGI